MDANGDKPEGVIDLTPGMEVKADELDLNAMALALLALRQQKADAEAALSGINKALEEHEQKLVQAMQVLERTKFDLDGKLFFLQTSSFPKVNKEREGDFYGWTKDHNEDGIYKMTVHPQTLRSWFTKLREELQAEIVEKGLLQVFEKIGVHVRSQ